MEPGQRTDWRQIDLAVLARRPFLLPHQIDELTLPEIALCLQVPTPGLATPTLGMSLEDARVEALEDVRLGPKGRLLRAAQR